MFDTHAHLTDPALFPLVDIIISRAHTEGVSHILNIATDHESLEKGLQLSKQYPSVLLAAADHPQGTLEDPSNLIGPISELIKQNSLVAIGETGLDYHFPQVDRKTQQSQFIKYLELAHAHSLPVIVHCRDAFDDLFKIIDKHHPEREKSPIIIHCFTGSDLDATKALERDFFLSFSGIVTFKNSTSLQEIVKKIPPHRLLIETDAPYLAPHPCRGKINEPAFVKHTIDFVAKLRNMELTELTKITSENAINLFKPKNSGKKQENTNG